MHHELKSLEKFAYHLRVDDREVFEEMMLLCQQYCSHSGDMASPVKEIPLLTAIIFGQHKMILDLQRSLKKRPPLVDCLLSSLRGREREKSLPDIEIE